MSKKRIPKKPVSFSDADVAEQVRLATPLANKLVLVGIQDVSSVCNPDEVALAYHVEALIGHSSHVKGLPNEWSDRVDENMWQYGEAAYALGIAVGLLMRPESFAKGGAR